MFRAKKSLCYSTSKIFNFHFIIKRVWMNNSEFTQIRLIINWRILYDFISGNHHYIYLPEVFFHGKKNIWIVLLLANLLIFIQFLKQEFIFSNLKRCQHCPDLVRPARPDLWVTFDFEVQSSTMAEAFKASL